MLHHINMRLRDMDEYWNQKRPRKTKSGFEATETKALKLLVQGKTLEEIHSLMEIENKVLLKVLHRNKHKVETAVMALKLKDKL